ncbi:MAG: pyruvate dehydrogenase (acetyl-transferring) E1 component subunit alpha [Flavobacteriales bacterium]|nr:pyruvate dehydrogenase (acetyl-transferring) E1 component subunit alpha [Flavobacteriales bacterium]
MATVSTDKKTTRKGSSGKPKFSKKQYLKWYEDMLVMRKIEEKCGQLYIQQKFGGFCHLYIGQEAVVAGTASACKLGDKHITAYRDHAHPIALGVHPKEMMAELYGKKEGMTSGKGGSMHMFKKEVGLMGGHGIVGAQIPMGAGIAFAEKYKKTGNVCITSFGDGAARQGALHETFNMAMKWKLPCVFIIENNNYAMGTSVERTTNVSDLSEMGKSYHMPSMSVDGMSVEAVHEAIEEACERARKGDGPTLLDIRTYRYKGHSMSDPQKYRTKQEVEDYKKEDPIEKVLDTLLKNKFATKAQIETIQERVKNIVAESVEFAENGTELTVDELHKDVYSADYPFIIE